MGSIQTDLREFLASELRRDVAAVADDESLLEAGIIDSLSMLQLVSFIERQYGLVVSEDEMMPENFDTVDAMAAFIASRRNNESA